MPYWEATREESSLQEHHHRFKAFGAPYFNLFWPSNYDMILSEEGNPALLLLMIIRDMHGCFSSSPTMKSTSTSSTSPSKVNTHMKKTSKPLGLTMVKISRTTPCKILLKMRGVVSPLASHD
jgi:hypothetical protein